MKMNLGEIIKNYSKAKSPECLQKELNSISNFEKELNSIDPNYKDNLFDKLLNSDKKTINNQHEKIGNVPISGMDFKDALSNMISLNDKNSMLNAYYKLIKTELFFKIKIKKYVKYNFKKTTMKIQMKKQWEAAVRW
jgi:hypothetical protein